MFVMKLITHRMRVPNIGIISSSSIRKANASRTHPRIDSTVTRMALITVVIASKTTHTNVVMTVHPMQTQLATQYQPTQIQVISLHPQEHGHQSQQLSSQSEHSL